MKNNDDNQNIENKNTDSNLSYNNLDSKNIVAALTGTYQPQKSSNNLFDNLDIDKSLSSAASEEENHDNETSHKFFPVDDENHEQEDVQDNEEDDVQDNEEDELDEMPSLDNSQDMSNSSSQTNFSTEGNDNSDYNEQPEFNNHNGLKDQESISLDSLNQNKNGSNNEYPEISDSISQVAANKGSSIAIIIILSLGIAYVVYKAIYPAAEKKTPEKTEVSQNVATIAPTENSSGPMIEPQNIALPDAPKLEAPVAPPTPVPPIVPTLEEQTSSADKKTANEMPLFPDIVAPVAAAPALPDVAVKTGMSAEQKLARIKSAMTVKGGATAAGSVVDLVDSAGNSYDAIPMTANQVKATKIGDLNRVIAQGKMIEAVLETAVNSDLPGVVRAIVSVDVMSEGGLNILIPRGSRLIGSYQSNITLGVSRIQVSWERVIRPDGIDIAIASSGVDPLGRAGLTGNVDNKYMQIFANTLMLSLINIGIAKYQDKMAKKDGSYGSSTSDTTTTTTSGTTTTSSGKQPSATTSAVNSAAESIANVGQGIVQQQISALKPTITIEQGTQVKVFVAKDLVFPKTNNMAGVNVLQ